MTPRFEIFYALRALAERSETTAGWRRDAAHLLPESFGEAVERVAPHPMMWALLADVLRDAKPDPTFREILSAIDSLGDDAFQQAILGGVFRATGVAAALSSGDQSLAEAVRSEGERGNSLLSLMGLYPFESSSAVSDAFARIISEPADYRADLARILEVFWESTFDDSWTTLQPRMQRVAETFQTLLEKSSLASFARGIKLPVIFDDRRKTVTTLRGAVAFPYAAVREIHIIPSAFNDARFWGAYSDESGSVRLYFPVLDSSLLRAEAPAVDPALGFRALGDTTRYAMAFLLAQSPRTSVELAKTFEVSKATISHHVRLLRTAGLLDERVTDRGVALTLNRKAVEKISITAAEEMFSGGNAPVIRRSRHERNRGKSTSKE